MAKKRTITLPEKLVWLTQDQVFGKVRKTKEFQEAYARETARITLAREIREARIARKMTQAAVAEKADMPQSAIARLESGTHSVSMDTLSRIAYVLKKKIQLV